MNGYEVASFVRQRSLGKRAVFRERVMVVGCEEAGKTSLIFRLTHPNQPSPDITKDKRTFGVITNRWKESDIEVEVTTREGTKEREKLEVEFWDFAGQTVFYPTHHLFLESNVVYLLVFSWEWVIGSLGVGRVGKMVEDWVSRVRSGGVKERILLVGTHKDQLDNPRTRSFYREQLTDTLVGSSKIDMKKDMVLGPEGRLVVVNISNKDGSDVTSGIMELKRWIGKLAVERTRQGGHQLGEEYPKSYLLVEEKIQQHLNSMVKVAGLTKEQYNEEESTSSESTFMTGEEFQKKFTTGFTRQDVLAMLQFFHLSGTVLWRSPSREDSPHQHPFRSLMTERELWVTCFKMVFLDPQWLMRELVPLINFLLEDNQPQHRAGIVGKVELQAHYHHLPEPLKVQVPKILEWFELLLPVEEDKFFIPLQLHDWDENNEHDGRFVVEMEATKKYLMEFSFIPDGMMSLLLFRLHQLAPNSLFRRNKCILEETGGDTKAQRCWMEVDGHQVTLQCSSQGDRFASKVVQTITQLVKERFSGIKVFVVARTQRGRVVRLEYFTQLEEYRDKEEALKVPGETMYYRDILPQRFTNSSSSSSPSSSSYSSSSSCSSSLDGFQLKQRKDLTSRE